MDRIDVGSIRVPGGGDKVYKDECMYCFDSPVSRKLYTSHNFQYYTLDRLYISYILNSSALLYYPLSLLFSSHTQLLVLKSLF